MYLKKKLSSRVLLFTLYIIIYNIYNNVNNLDVAKMDKQPQLSFVHNRRKNASNIKQSAVELRITYNYQQKYISSGIMLTLQQWKKGRVVNRPDAIQLNQVLDNMLAETRQIILEMSQKKYINIKSIPKLLHNKTSNQTFLDFCKKRAAIRKYGKSKDNMKRYDRFIQFFDDWGEIVDISDITEENIIRFDEFLSSKNLKDSSKWNCYHRFLNSFISDAIDDGQLYRNPYKHVSINKGHDEDSLSKCLTYEEFCKIKDVKLSTKSLERVRDTFVFQTYTCLSYADLKNFSIEDIIEVKGTKVYTGNRQKTNKSFVIPLIPTALEILKKYNNKLPVISSQRYNDFLKVVAQAAGVDKPITSHWARHTGATLLLNEGVDIKIISKICGHSSSKITEQIYAKLMDETVVDAIKEIEENLK